MKNYGVLPGPQKRVTDFVAGTLPHEVKLPSGDWNREAWYSIFQKQSSVGGDRMNCVTQSHHNLVQETMNFDIAQGLMPTTHQEWLKRNGYMDEKGRVQFSRKFSCLLNKTTNEGNWLWRVADYARKIIGIIPESMFKSETDEQFEDFYKDRENITEEMYEMGREFMEYFELPYEWIDNTKESIEHHLKQSPLQMVRPGHAIELVTKHKEGAYEVTYLDSYPNPWVKEYGPLPTSVLKVLVNYKKIPTMFDFKRVKDGNGDVFLVKDGVKTLIYNQGAFQLIGDWDKIVEVSQEELDAIPDSGVELAAIVKE